MLPVMVGSTIREAFEGSLRGRTRRTSRMNDEGWTLARPPARDEALGLDPAVLAAASLRLRVLGPPDHRVVATRGENPFTSRIRYRVYKEYDY